MSNDLCCIMTIQKKDYEHITSRLASFEMQYSETKQFQICLMTGASQANKKLGQTNKKLSHKWQGTIIRLTDRNFSNYLVGPYNSGSYDEKFIYQASYLRVENTFKSISKGWSVFGDLKELFSQKIEIETYVWKKAFVFEFIHGEKDVLFIMRDCTSSNHMDKNAYPNVNNPVSVLVPNPNVNGNNTNINTNTNTTTNTNPEREFWKARMVSHFRDMYGVLSSNFGEHIHEGHQAIQGSHTKSKIAEFDERVRIFIDKLDKFPEKRSPQFWLIRVACIAEFLLKHRLLVKNQMKKQG